MIIDLFVIVYAKIQKLSNCNIVSCKPLLSAGPPINKARLLQVQEERRNGVRKMPDGKSSDSEMFETSGEHGVKEDNYQYQNAGLNHTYDTPEPATIETSMEEKDVQADLKKLPPLKKFDPSNKSDQMTDL